MEVNITSIMLKDSRNRSSLVQDIRNDKKWFLESFINNLTIDKENFVISSRKEWAVFIMHELPRAVIKYYPIQACGLPPYHHLRGRNIGTIALYDMTINEIMECEGELMSCMKHPNTKFIVSLDYGERLENFLNKTDINSFGPLSSSILRKLEFIN